MRICHRKQIPLCCERRCCDFQRSQLLFCNVLRGFFLIFFFYRTHWTLNVVNLQAQFVVFSPGGSLRRQKSGPPVYKQNAASCFLRWHVKDSCKGAAVVGFQFVKLANFVLVALPVMGTNVQLC